MGWVFESGHTLVQLAPPSVERQAPPPASRGIHGVRLVDVRDHVGQAAADVVRAKLLPGDAGRCGLDLGGLGLHAADLRDDDVLGRALLEIQQSFGSVPSAISAASFSGGITTSATAGPDGAVGVVERVSASIEIALSSTTAQSAAATCSCLDLLLVRIDFPPVWIPCDPYAVAPVRNSTAYGRDGQSPSTNADYIGRTLNRGGAFTVISPIDTTPTNPSDPTNALPGPVPAEEIDIGL